MKLSSIAIILGAAVTAAPNVVSAEVSSCLGGLVRECISRELVYRRIIEQRWLYHQGRCGESIYVTYTLYRDRRRAMCRVPPS